MKNITIIVIPNGVTIPASVTFIGDYAFSGTVLEGIIMPINISQ